MPNSFFQKDSVDVHTYHDHGALSQDSANLVTVASLVVQVWEAAVCFPDEIQHLWKGDLLGAVKALYACSRYLMLLGQIVNQALSIYLFTHPLTDRTLCRTISISQAICMQMNVFFMEVVITLRAFALYNQWRRIKFFFLFAFATSVLLEFGATGIFIHTMIAPSGCNFSPAAGAKDVSIYFFSAGAVLGQIVPVVSIVTGLIWRHRLGKSQTPLTSMLLNQGLATCILVLALVVSMMIYNFFPQLRLGMHDGHAMLSWYNTLLSVATCRLLLQMWKLAADEREKNYPRRDALNRRSSIILTTVIMESHRQITDTTSTMPTYSITTPKNTRMK